MATIYRIFNTLTGKSYVGSSEDTDYRWRKHREMLVAGRHHSTKLQRSWDKHGEGVWVWEVVEKVDPADLIAREQFHIDRLDACAGGYNMSPVAGRVAFTDEMKAAIGEANRKRVWTPESRAKIAEVHRGNQYGRGRVHSEEARQAMSKAATGREKSPEHRAKIGSAQKGRTFSEETRSNMSAAKRNKPRSPEAIAKMNETIRAKMLAGTNGRPEGYVRPYVMTDDHKRKNTENCLRRNGFQSDPEVRRRISEGLKKRDKSKDTRTKDSFCRKGIKMPSRTPEQKENYRKAALAANERRRALQASEVTTQSPTQ